MPALLLTFALLLVVLCWYQLQGLYQALGTPGEPRWLAKGRTRLIRWWRCRYSLGVDILHHAQQLLSQLL